MRPVHGPVRLLMMMALVMVMAALAAACSSDDSDDGGAGPSGEPKYGGTLTFTMFADSATLDPPLLITTPDILLAQAFYDTLVQIQPDLSLKPMLATSWEANDDLTSYTFNLREGVKFHHGKEFKAEDVLFSFNRLLDPVLDSPARTTMEVIDSMTILDDYTIRFDLTSPSVFFPDVLSIYQAQILPADVDISRLTLEEFGTGPFTMVEHLPNERTVMTKNPDYWEEGRPYLDEVVMLPIPEPETRTEALKSGDVDVVFVMQPQSAPGIEAYDGTKVVQSASASYLNLSMDTQSAPFDNILVRKAMQAATDREAISQAALFGNGVIANDHPIPPNDPHFAPQYAPPPYDIELAKSLLAEAGYPDGIDVTLYTSTVGPGLVDMAVVMKEKAAPAGIRIDIQQKPEDAFWVDYWIVEPFTTVFWNGRPPDQALSITTASDSQWNAAHYDNPIIDELIVKARGQDLAGRRETYGEIQRILVDEVPRIIPVFQPVLYGARDEVYGIPAHPLGWQILTEAWLDR